MRGLRSTWRRIGGGQSAEGKPYRRRGLAMRDLRSTWRRGGLAEGWPCAACAAHGAGSAEGNRRRASHIGAEGWPCATCAAHGAMLPGFLAPGLKFEFIFLAWCCLVRQKKIYLQIGSIKRSKKTFFLIVYISFVFSEFHEIQTAMVVDKRPRGAFVGNETQKRLRSAGSVGGIGAGSASGTMGTGTATTSGASASMLQAATSDSIPETPSPSPALPARSRTQVLPVDAAHKNAEPKEAEPQDVATKDAARKDAARKDAAPKDDAPKYSTSKNATPKDDAPKDTASEDADNSTQEQTAQDSAAVQPNARAEERPAAATSATTHFQDKSIKCASGDLCRLPGGFFEWTAQAQAYSAATYGPDKTGPVRCHDCRENRNRLCMLARRGPHQGAGGSGGGRGGGGKAARV